jgi:lysozyme
MADFLLEERVGADYEFLKGLLKITLTINQIIALLSLMFNIGRGAFQGSTLLKKINVRASLSEIEFEFLRWNKINKKENKGLMVRRKREWEMFLK